MAGLSCRLLTGTPSCRAVGGGMLVKMVSCPWVAWILGAGWDMGGVLEV